MSSDNQQYLMEALHSPPSDTQQPGYTVLATHIKTEPIDITEVYVDGSDPEPKEVMHQEDHDPIQDNNNISSTSSFSSSSSEDEEKEDEDDADHSGGGGGGGCGDKERGNPYSCPRCNKQYYYMKPYKKHIDECTVRVVVPPSEAPISQEGQAEIYRRNPPRGDVTKRCIYCSKMCSSLKALQKHLRLKHTKRILPKPEYREQFPCLDCNRVFTLKANLQVHVIRYHTKSPRAPVKSKSGVCRLCDKLVRNLAGHEKAHNLINVSLGQGLIVSGGPPKKERVAMDDVDNITEREEGQKTTTTTAVVAAQETEHGGLAKESEKNTTAADLSPSKSIGKCASEDWVVVE